MRAAKTNVFISVGMALLTGGLGIYFALPNDQEFNFMRFKDGHFESVLPFYENRFSHGSRDHETVATLMHSYEGVGAPMQAQKVLRQLIREGDQQWNAKERLLDSFVKTGMEANLAEMSPVLNGPGDYSHVDENFHNVLVMAYWEKRNDFQQLQPMLQQKFSAGRASEMELSIYAQLLSAQGDDEAALAAWSAAVHRPEANHRLQGLKNIYALLAKQNRTQDILPIVKTLLDTGADPRHYLPLADWVLAKNDFATFDGLLALGGASDNSESVRELLLANVQLRSGSRLEARNALVRLFEKNELSTRDTTLLLELLLEPPIGSSDLISKAVDARFGSVNVSNITEYEQHVYVSALKALNRSDEIRDYWRRVLKARHSHETETQAVQALYGLDDFDLIVPALARLSEAHGEPWLAMLNVASERTNNRKAFISALKMRSTKRDLADSEKSTLAALLLENGDKDSAESLLIEIAHTQPTSHENVAALLYMWGPRPGETAMNWLAERAKNASGVQRVAWLEILLERGGSDYILQLYKPESVNIPIAEHRVYLQALRKTGRTEQWRKSVVGFYPQLSDSLEVKDLAYYAVELGDQLLAENIWRYLASIKPDPDAHRFLAELAFTRRQWSDAAKLLAEYVAQRQDSADGLFLYGEALRRLGREADAIEAYRNAVTALKAKSPKLRTEQLLYGTLLTRIDDKRASVEEFDQLLKRYPGDPDVLEHYARALIDQGEPEKAKQLLIDWRVAP